MNLALKGGFLVNEEPIKGKPHKLRVGDPLPEEATLPKPELLFRHPTHPGIDSNTRTPPGNAAWFCGNDCSNGGFEHPHCSNRTVTV